MKYGERAEGNADSRLFMICIDAMSLDFARAHLDQLPTLRALLADGAFADLGSPAEFASASVWPTFACGADPGVHGNYYPFQWDAATMRYRRTSARRWLDEFSFEPFWYRLSRNGVPSIAFDAGIALDHTKAPCREITNWSYQSSGMATASDPALLGEIRRRFGHRPIGKEVPVPKTLNQSRQIRDSLIDAMRRKTDAILWLMERDAWRFFLTGFYEVHRAGHNLLVVDGDFGSQADPDALLEVYKAQDHELGRILARLRDGRTTSVLFSLHGMAPNRVQDHVLDEILARLNKAYLVEIGAKAPPKKAPNLISRLRARVPYGFQYSLAQMMGEHVQDWVVNRSMTAGFDWKRTPSFRLASGGECYIRLNIKGRERNGYFDRSGEEISRYKIWLKERLSEIRIVGDETPLVGEVIDVDDLFPGSRKDYLPDLIVTCAADAPVHAIKSNAIGEISAELETGRGGNHTGDAFVVAIGPGAAHPAFRRMRDIKDIGGFAEALFRAPTAESLESARRPAACA